MKQLVLGLLAAAAVSSASPAQAVCTPTGFIRDATNLTAAMVNPVVVAGTIDATGCDIGIYFSHGPVLVNSTVIRGARYFGIVVDGGTTSMVATITNNLIHNIGAVPFDGTQKGVGIYLEAYNTAIVTGTVTGNTVTAYQKGGIVANGKGVRLTKIDDNFIEGLGHVNFIAQNGIQVGFGAMPYPSEIVGNHVSVTRTSAHRAMDRLRRAFWSSADRTSGCAAACLSRARTRRTC